MEKAIKFSAEVADALKARKPVVALESTIISHGLPRPSNLEVALECERIVREAGAVPATIALLDGKVLVGLERPELEAIANRDDIAKASIRDLAIIVAQGKSAATTVAATAHIAAISGINIFATGGLGGVHRGDGFESSTDHLCERPSPLGRNRFCSEKQLIRNIDLHRNHHDEMSCL